MSCNCEGKNYSISMGCCEPVLAPIENYYTKYQIDKMIASAVTSGCCITPEEVDEKIEEAISGITVSGVTEEELNNAIASAKTEIEAEIPTVPTKVSAFENDVPYLTEHQSLSGYATEEWVLDKHYISGVDLSDYALKSEIPTVPTSNTAFTNDAGYLTEHQSLTAYSTTNEVNELINQSVSGKQDTLSAGTNITIVDNVISATGGGGGDSCTVNEKVIVKPYDSLLYSNLDSVYVCYSGQTYGQYYYLLIDGTSFWINGLLNFSTGGHTGSTSGWEDYYTVAWDSANTRFLFTAKGNYKISQINNTNLYFQVPLYTISGTSCDAAETLADALNDTIADVQENSIAIENKVDSSTLNNYLLKSKIWCGTQSDYDLILNKDSETLYLIHE